MRTDKEIGERGFRRFGCILFAAVLQIGGVGLGAAGACGGGKVENDEAKHFKACRDSVGREIPDA